MFQVSPTRELRQLAHSSPFGRMLHVTARTRETLHGSDDRQYHTNIGGGLAIRNVFRSRVGEVAVYPSSRYRLTRKNDRSNEHYSSIYRSRGGSLS
jgi:hypothetical protein